MQRIIIVYNPCSSRFSDVKKDVLDPAKNLKGYMIGKYEVEKTNLDDNIAKLSKLVKDKDLIIAAGGDATGIIASNSILKSGKDATLAVLPYGNFNDLSRTLGTKTFSEVINKCDTWAGDGAGGTPAARSVASTVGETATTGPAQNFYPLEIIVDGELFRYATCYVTIGMTAEAVKLYDTPSMRRKLKSDFGRKVTSYTELASWYFKNRHKKQFIPEFKLNGILQHKDTSDYAALNGRSMARVMKGGEDFKNPKIFHSETDRLTNLWRLTKLMFRSILFRTPGSETTKDIIEFINPATVEIQTEGEWKKFENIKKIEIRKGKKCLKVITN